MIGLPEVVQSQILSSFCDGKSIATYFHVISCNESLKAAAFDLLRDALVDRYQNIAQDDRIIFNEEAKDVIDIIREEIRTCRAMQSANSGALSVIIGEDSHMSSRESASKKISDYCAIIDYFDRMRQQSPEKVGEFVLWCGGVQSQGGRIRRASLCSKFWSVTAMDFFYDQLELNNHGFTHPASSAYEPPFGDPFGTLDVSIELENDEFTFKRVEHSLSEDLMSSRSVLVPSQMEYEYSIGFALNRDLSERRNFACYWDLCDDGDFEYSLSRLPENVIRVLTRLESEA